MIRKSREKRDIAQEIIQDLGRESLLGYFRQRLAGAQTLATRHMLVEAYARLAGAEAIPTLVAICRDADERLEVRAAAAQALGTLGATEGVDALISTLSAPDSSLRIAAAKALGQIGDARAVEPLISLLGEEESSVMTAVAEALVSLRVAKSVPRLREVLDLGRIDPLTAERVHDFVRSVERLSPDQLIPRVPYFVGREAEVEALYRALEEKPTAIVSVLGMGGLGKTSLAAHVARLVDTDHRLWLSCAQWTDIADLFRELARQLAIIGETAPLDYLTETHELNLRELRNWLRLAFGRGRYLLVLDDFEVFADDPEMRDFLQDIAYQANVKLLITSRMRVELPQVTEIVLAALPRAQVIELIQHKGLDLTQDEIDRIVELTGGIPLAVELALGLMRTRGKEALEQALPEDRERLYQHLIGRVLEQLDAREFQALRILSVFDTPISPSDEDIIDIFESEGIDFAGEVLANLGRYSVVILHTNNTFDLHPLIRGFIESTIDLTDRERLHRKVAEYYLHNQKDLLRAARHYHAGGASREAARLLASSIRRLINEGHAASARDLLASIATSEQLSSKQQSDVTHALGELAAFLGDYDQALEYYQHSLAIKEEIGDRAGLATTYNNIGEIHRARGDYESALAWYEKSVALAEELGDRASLATSYNNIGEIHRARSDYDTALNYYQRSFAIKEELGDKSGLAVTLHNIGAVHQDKGQWDEAITCYQHSLKIAEELGDKVGLALGLRNLGDVTLASGEVTRALEFFARSQTLFAELGLNKQANELEQEIEEIRHKTLDEKQLMLLLQTLTSRFDGEELASLYFDLGIDYASLPGEGKAAKARELVAYLERRGRLGELFEVVGVRPAYKATVTIPSRRMGLLIGRGGETIRWLMEITDTRIWIDDDTRVVTIEGSTQRKVDAALRRIRAIIPEAR